MIFQPRYLVAVVVLAACAGGTTMRVADDNDTDTGPVALAPEPEPASDSVAPMAPSTAAEQPESGSTDTTSQQGYAPYASSASTQVRRIGQWTHTGINERRRLVIRDANAWATFWSELGVGDRPAVDFSRDLVVAVAAGQQSSGGYEVAVDRVTQNNGELTIEVVETSPGPNCITTSALTQPVDVVVTSRVNARGWSFVERKEVRGCR